MQTVILITSPPFYVEQPLAHVAKILVVLCLVSDHLLTFCMVKLIVVFELCPVLVPRKGAENSES